LVRKTPFNTQEDRPPQFYQQTMLQLHAVRERSVKRGWTRVEQIKEVRSSPAQRERREALLAVACRREVDVVLVL
jgi:hypothetical protein